MTRPALFTDLTFDAALAKAAAEDKLLLVDATAEWCGPCKMMDRTTWVDLRVIDWLATRAIAIQIDVDAQKDVAKQLAIHAMPTLIVFKAGAEFDRVVGAKKSAELIDWLEGVLRGETAIDRMSTDDVNGRSERARALLHAGRYAEATPEYVWLWEHMLESEPSLYGVKHSFFVGELIQIVRAHTPARDAFVALRDKIDPSTEEAFHDWSSLNRVLGERDATVKWFDTHQPVPPALCHIVERVVVPLLVERERWADVGALYRDPLASFAKHVQILAHMLNQSPDKAEFVAQHRRGLAAQIVRALIAANRSAEAEAVADEARRVDPSPEMAEALDQASRHT